MRSPKFTLSAMRLILPAALFFLAAAAAFPACAQDTGFDSRNMPYAAFDKLPATEIRVGGSTIYLAYAPGGEYELSRSAIAAWVERCAKTVARYYGRFPVAKYRLLIMPVASKGVRGGTTYGYHGAATKLRLGQAATMEQLNSDWVLIHEMIHTAFPSMPDKHHWIEEGIATYVEGISRVQNGNLDAAAMWMSLVKGMPNGLPEAGDAGLDNTHTWGRTYWGGALFCLVADIRIRERTANRYGLQDALRAIVHGGGSIEDENWSIEQALQTADNATGTHVLEELYRQSANDAVDPGLPALWQKLGIVAQGDHVVFDDKSPEADVRKAITSPH